MNQLKLYLFGPPRLERNGLPLEIKLRKVLALLVYLAATRQRHSRQALATLFWPENNQRSALANLRRALYALNQAVGEQLLAVEPDTVSLRSDIDFWIDIEHFRALLDEGLALAALVTRLVEATALYKDDFLSGFTLPDCPAFDDWQFFQREDLRRSFASLLQQMVALYEAEENLDQAAHYARRWLALDPLEEAVHRRLMQIFAQAGQPAAALRQYEECARILTEELDVAPEQETTALYEAIRTRRFPGLDRVRGWQGDKAGAKPRPPVTQPLPHNLPLQTTSFVGRRHELDHLVRRLSDPDCHLLTLVGPGGIGKTRLAIEVAQRILDSRFGILDSPVGSESSLDPTSQIRGAPSIPKFDDGVFFVALQPVNIPSGVIPAIASALGFQFYDGAPPQQQLLTFLHEKQLLLILDNFEHLLPSADLVVEILASAPGVKMLVTSREALKLEEEWFHPLAGMRLPPEALRILDASVRNLDSGGIGNTDDHANDHEVGAKRHPISQSRGSDWTPEFGDAAELFIQTARRAQVNFDPATHSADIVRICRLVDGMPLAIVLAASWLKVLTCEQIASEIEHNMDILVTRHQNVPERHRSMRAVLEHSWRLLSVEAQQVLRQISVFQGGFLPGVATAVAGATLLTLSELVEKAWLYTMPDGRYQLHELLRQFALEKLTAQASDEATTRDRHAEFFLQQLAQREAALNGPQQRSALDEIGDDLENIRAAWLRAGAHFVGAERPRGDTRRMDDALHSFYLFFQMRSRYAEGEEIFAHALVQLDRRTATEDASGVEKLRCRLLARQGGCRLMQGRLDAASNNLKTALSGTTDLREQAFINFTFGLAEKVRGNRTAAEAAYQRCLRLSREIGDQNGIAEALLGLADTASSFGNWIEGRQLALEALAICRRLQRPDITARVIASLAWATNCLGDYADSARYYRESLAIAEAIGDPHGIALATNFLGWVAFCEGGPRLAKALPLYEQALAIWRQIGHRVNLSMCLGDYALAANELGDYATAQRCAQEGLAITEELNHLDHMAYNLYGLGAAACGLGELQEGRQYLLRSLQIASESQILPQASAALYFFARLLIIESQSGSLSDAEQVEKRRQTVALLAWVIHQPATWQLFRDRAQLVLAELVDGLPADIEAAAQQHGQQRELDSIVAELLSATHTPS